MFSVRSWSPPEMNTFSPSRWKHPGSPAGIALHRLSPTLLPAPASVRHIVPPHSPVYMRVA